MFEKMVSTSPDVDPLNVSVTTRVCFDLRVIDALPHHPCYNWNHSLVQCEIDWPCEVRQYLVTISPLISITRGLLSYGTFFIIFLGLFLNLLSLYTLVSSGLSKSGSGIYLVSLAICDCGNLIFNYLVGIARAHLPGFNELFMESEWLCRWHGVFVEVFQLISAWIVVSFSVERCLAIWYPMLLRHTSRRGRAKKVLLAVGTVLTLFSLTKLILTGFEKDSVFGYRGCYSHRYRWQGIAYIRVAFQTWIPTVLVFIFNLLMFCKLRSIKRQRKRLTEVKEDRRTVRKRGSFINRPSPTAPMLVAVSLAYLVLVFPLGVVQTVELIWIVYNKQPVYNLGDVVARQQFINWKNTRLLLKYVRGFCFAFYQINFCINFFLYFAAGLQFRIHLQRKVQNMFGRWCCFCCGGSGKIGGDVPEPATPGTSSSVLDSRRSSMRSIKRKSSHQSHHRVVISRSPSISPEHMEVEQRNGGIRVEEAMAQVEVMIRDYQMEGRVEECKCRGEGGDDVGDVGGGSGGGNEEDGIIVLEELNPSPQLSYQFHEHEHLDGVLEEEDDEGDLV